MAPDITPPPELVQEWAQIQPVHQAVADHWQHIAARAAQWGADRELEACCTELDQINCQKYWSESLRAARRPKPPSLKELALDALGPEPLPETGPTGDTILNKGSIKCHRIIRRALEALPE